MTDAPQVDDPNNPRPWDQSGVFDRVPAVMEAPLPVELKIDYGLKAENDVLKRLADEAFIAEPGKPIWYMQRTTLDPDYTDNPIDEEAASQDRLNAALTPKNFISNALLYLGNSRIIKDEPKAAEWFNQLKVVLYSRAKTKGLTEAEMFPPGPWRNKTDALLAEKNLDLKSPVQGPRVIPTKP